MTKKKALVLIKLMCIIGIFLGIINLWRHIKEGYWYGPSSNYLYRYSLSLFIVAIIFNLSLIIFGYLTLKLKSWARRIFISILLINLFGTLLCYVIIQNQLSRFFLDIMMPVSTMLLDNYIRFRYVINWFPLSFWNIVYWGQFFLLIVILVIPVFYLIRPKVKEQFNLSSTQPQQSFPSTP